MFRLTAIVISLSFTALSAASAVTIDWSSVGNPGNTSDPLTGHGAVAYSYSIGTYDVTVSQYVEFLNAKDPTGSNALGLTNSDMLGGPNGYVRFNASNPEGSRYTTVVGAGNLPEDYVTFYDALRYVNWLGNGQGNGDTEIGAYTLLGGTPTPSNGNSITRNAGAMIVLPSLDEWYKAAYYNPANGTYYQYATSSNTAPVANLPTSTPNSANYNHVARGPTDVGAYTASASPYGAYDMNGDLRQWNETSAYEFFRGVAGGTWATGVSEMASAGYLVDSPFSEGNLTGFRVAMIPEPSTLILAALGGLALLAMRRRKFAR